MNCDRLILVIFAILATVEGCNKKYTNTQCTTQKIGYKVEEFGTAEHAVFTVENNQVVASCAEGYHATQDNTAEYENCFYNTKTKRYAINLDNLKNIFHAITCEPGETVIEPEPATEAPEPVTEAPGPVTEAPEPVTEAPEPATKTPEPATEAPEPVTEAPGPVTEAPEPATEAPEPATETPEPPTEAPEPATEAPEPATEAPEPATEAPEPSATEPATEAPEPEVVSEMSVITNDLDSAEILKSALDKHNELRQATMTDAEGKTYHAVNIPNLVWDDTIAKNALAYARHQRDIGSNELNKGCIMDHSEIENRTMNGEKLGENLAWKGWSRPFAADFGPMIEWWWNEVKDFAYDDGIFDKDSCRKPCTHFTQIMWADTLRLGCAAVACPRTRPRAGGYRLHGYLLVCQYGGMGNWMDQKMFDREME